MSTSYEISEAAADDWQKIATYIMKKDGEDAVRNLYKAFEKSIKKMANEDEDFVHYIYISLQSRGSGYPLPRSLYFWRVSRRQPPARLCNPAQRRRPRATALKAL
jgi:hypothetical protein